MKTKKEFLASPHEALVGKEVYPEEWLLLALETNTSFRDDVFSIIARYVGKGEYLSTVGWRELLPKMSQALRDELFCLCCELRDVSEWYDSFVAVVGPETPGIASEISPPRPTKEEFFKNPYDALFAEDIYPDEWVLIALETDRLFRNDVFSIIARHVANTKNFHGAKLSKVLPKMSQALRDELFCLCCEARDVSEWYDSFVAVVGPETPRHS